MIKKILFFLVLLCPLTHMTTAQAQTAPTKTASTSKAAPSGTLPPTTKTTSANAAAKDAPSNATPPKQIVFCYQKGMTVDQLTACAEQGDANAQLELGTLHHEGEGGVTKDYKKGFEWTLKAAHQGNAQAQYLVGVMFTRGSGTRLDYDKAFKWYSVAAEQGNANAQRSLGAIYYKAEGVRRDYVLSYMWLNLAAIQGDAAALKFRDTVVKKLNSEQLTKAQQMSTDWLAKHTQPK